MKFSGIYMGMMRTHWNDHEGREPLRAGHSRPTPLCHSMIWRPLLWAVGPIRLPGTLETPHWPTSAQCAGHLRPLQEQLAAPEPAASGTYKTARLKRVSRLPFSCHSGNAFFCSRTDLGNAKNEPLQVSNVFACIFGALAGFGALGFENMRRLTQMQPIQTPKLENLHRLNSLQKLQNPDAMSEVRA